MSWTHLRDTNPKAKKEHKCFLCGEKILVGEKYISRSGIDDVGLTSFAMHVECEDGTKDWTPWDWECTSEGEADRPKKGVASECS